MDLTDKTIENLRNIYFHTDLVRALGGDSVFNDSDYIYIPF